MQSNVHIVLITLVPYVWTAWIDPDSHNADRNRVSFSSGKVFNLVMSDEFNTNGRSFNDGDDSTWTALEKWDDDEPTILQYYNASNVFTQDGRMHIRTSDKESYWKYYNPYLKKYVRSHRNFRSGMVQSWNKFCFTGGIIEVAVKLPGNPYVGGLWPAVWLLGNLGRATFKMSTNKMWPWSYSICDRKLQKAQEISGCSLTDHYSLNRGQGRGATEIDLFEIMSGTPEKLPLVSEVVHRPYASMTLQLAPGIPPSRRPWPGHLPVAPNNTWYSNLTVGTNTSINPFFYGMYDYMPMVTVKPWTHVNWTYSEQKSYQCDAVSSMFTLDASFWNELHTFRLEWQPGLNGFVHWYVDDEYKFGIEGVSLRPMGTEIPSEPSAIILNTAISTDWGFPSKLPQGCRHMDCKQPYGRCAFHPGFCESLPTDFEIDYVRVYQDPTDDNHTVGCNPRSHPTARFIRAHEYRYKRPSDRRALLPLRRGGGRCDGENDCGSRLGRGFCNLLIGHCVCRSGWVGPRCLVAEMKDDSEDWEATKNQGTLGHWRTFLIHGPFATAGTILFLGFFVVILILVTRKRHYSSSFA